MIKGIGIDFCWVPTRGIYWNEKCDFLAKHGAIIGRDAISITLIN